MLPESLRCDRPVPGGPPQAPVTAGGRPYREESAERDTASSGTRDAGHGRRLEARPSSVAGAAARGGAGLSGKWATHGTSRARGTHQPPESVGLRRQEREPRPLRGLPPTPDRTEDSPHYPNVLTRRFLPVRDERIATRVLAQPLASGSHVPRFQHF